MKRTLPFLLLAFLFTTTLCISTPRVSSQSNTSQKDLFLPRHQTEEEIQNELINGGVGLYPWECNPDLYGFTPPPEVAFRFLSEYESTAGVLIGWPSWGCQIPEITELIRVGVAIPDYAVTVVTNFRTSAESCLRSGGLSDDEISLIRWTASPIPVDTIWFRDYGPEVVNGEDGTRMLIDMSYYPGPTTTNCSMIRTRPLDDASPTRLTELGGDKWAISVHRPQVRAEGGNLQTDGQGTCFRMRRVTLLQNQFSRWFYSQEELDGVFSQYYNCNMVVLESLVGGVIDHIDMHTTVISPTKILVGQYNPEYDPMNAAILDRNAATLEKLGYTVVRVPMPRPYCSDGGFPSIPNRTRPCVTTYESRRVWATYLNSILLGNKMVVPIYRDLPEDLREEIESQEAEALAIFQRELDAEFGKGAIQIVPVLSDRMITGQGSVHCVTITYK